MPEIQKANRIRALDRGLIVVELLSRNGQMTLGELRHATGLSNPTLLRILATLQDRNWARRNIVEGRYELAHSLGGLLGDNARAHPLAEIATPILLALKPREAGWPSDLCAVLGPGLIEIIESTRLRGPMAPTRTALGLRPSMVFSAHGRAILAYSSPRAVADHLSVMTRKGTKQDRLWIENGRFDAEIDATRKRGYGLREPGYWAPPFDPGPALGAMAVPILSQNGLHGTISLVWMSDNISLDHVLELGGLDDLRKASARIGVALECEGIVAPLSERHPPSGAND